MNECTRFCEVCGDCLDCYGYDPCIDDGIHVAPIAVEVDGEDE